MKDSVFKDHFSPHAADYARYRPRYPDALYTYLAGLTERHALAWDCATGNGQAAHGLARHYARVVATDASTDQIGHAAPHPRVAYHVAPASHAPLDDAAADLVTVAQALHWLPFDAFYAEVRRIARPGGVFAAWTYGLHRISPEVDPIIDHYYRDIVGMYWPPERRLIEAQYQTVPFPFAEIIPPALHIEAQWRLDEVLGYLGTWSATRRFLARHGHLPLGRIREALAAAWGPPAEARTVRWPLYLRVGHVQ